MKLDIFFQLYRRADLLGWSFSGQDGGLQNRSRGFESLPPCRAAGFESRVLYLVVMPNGEAPLLHSGPRGFDSLRDHRASVGKLRQSRSPRKREMLPVRFRQTRGP